LSVRADDFDGCIGLRVNSLPLAVTLAPTPIATIQFTENSGTSNDGIVCGGTNISLSASSTVATRYDWYRNVIEPAFLVGSNTATVTVTPSIYTSQYTTTYYVVSTGATGCTRVTSQAFTVLPLPVITLTTNAGAYLTTDPITLTATGSISGYSWTGPNSWTASGSTSATVTRNPIVAGTYTVVGTGSNGCTASATVTPLILNSTCLPSGTIILGSGANRPTLTSVRGTVIPATALGTQGGAVTNVLIVGKFTTNSSSYTFNNCNIVFAAGGDWLHNNAELTFNDCTLKGCDKMWKGFTLSFAGTLIMNNTTVNDAYHAIDYSRVSGNSTHRALLNNCTFNKNYVSIYYDGTKSATPTPIERLENCTFNCSSNLLPAYIGQPEYRTRSYAAMVLLNKSFIDLNLPATAHTNIIKNMNIGISASSVVLNVENFRFQNIAPMGLTNATDYSAIDGTGIVITGIDKPSASNIPIGQLTQKGFGSTVADITTNPTFSNCRRGIYAGYAMIDIQNNAFTGTQAIYAEDCSDGKTALVVDNNRILTTESPIELIHNRYAIIRNNNIVMNANTVPINGSAMAAVVVQGGEPESHFIENNTIQAWYGNGVFVNNTPFTTISDNNISVTSSSFPAEVRSAIRLDGSNSSTLGCNRLIGGTAANNTLNKLFPIGVEINNSVTTTISCNQLDILQNGVVFSGACRGGTGLETKLLHNEFGTSVSANLLGSGLYIRGTASVDNQFTATQNYGNEWQSTTNVYAIAGARHDGVKQGSVFTGQVKATVNTKYYPPSFYLPNNTPTTSSLGWFSSSNISNIAQCPTNPSGLCATNGLATHTDITTDIAVAIGAELASELAEDVYKWDSRTLYTKLKENPSLVLNEALLTNFRDSLDATFVEELYLIAKKQAEAQADNTASLALEISAKRLDSLQIIVIAETDTTAKASKIAEMEAEQQNYQNYAIANANLRDAKIAEAKLMNDDLIVSEQYAYNEKIVNAAYFTSIAQGVQDIDALALPQLQAIAAQCPIIGGPAVYRARDLVYKYNRTIYNDHDLCAQQGVSFRVAKPKTAEKTSALATTFSVAPNPTNLFTIIKSNNTASEDLPITITDTYGRVIGTSIFYKNTNQTILTTEAWGAGIYYCKVGETLHKIVVVK
jgi:Secretion system C-terminal sorting domain